MKIIDMLDRFTKGEEVKFKVIETNEIFSTKNGYMYNESFDESADWVIYEDWFNLEVEVIEEDKKIPEKIDNLIGYDIQQFDDLKEYVEITTNDLFGKVNKVIDTLNQLTDYLKSKGW